MVRVQVDKQPDRQYSAEDRHWEYRTPAGWSVRSIARMGSRMKSGPVEQFNPITSMGKTFKNGVNRADISTQKHATGCIQCDLSLDWKPDTCLFEGLSECQEWQL